MDNFEINITAYNSGDVEHVRAYASVEEYEMESDGTEHVTFTLSGIEIERRDGSVVEVDEEELEALLTVHDLRTIEHYILEECRYSI
jgi:hypothetical protein